MTVNDRFGPESDRVLAMTESTRLSASNSGGETKDEQKLLAAPGHHRRSVER
jgi:hypothetical protein